LVCHVKREDRLRVFESGVLWGVFGARREEFIGYWRKLHIEELHGMYSSIVWVIQLRRMGGKFSMEGREGQLGIFGEH
jgi:hypothetical protein